MVQNNRKLGAQADQPAKQAAGASDPHEESGWTGGAKGNPPAPPPQQTQARPEQPNQAAAAPAAAASGGPAAAAGGQAAAAAAAAAGVAAGGGRLGFGRQDGVARIVLQVVVELQRRLVEDAHVGVHDDAAWPPAAAAGEQGPHLVRVGG